MDFVSNHVEETLNASGFNHFGWTRLERPLSMDFYRDWISAGHHAGMDYLAEQAFNKENPTAYAPKARSAIVVAKNYLPHPYPQKNSFPSFRTALYASGGDYHPSLKSDLRTLADNLFAKFPDEEFLCFTDTAPILERDLAYRAGLGWIGKNTCAIDREKGSLFFIGEIYTSLDLPAKSAPVMDMCGTCDRCLRACPTGAIEAPRVLNAGKCISYWTIESKEVAPVELREKFGDWFFGCDICQTVCPWNEKAFSRDLMKSLSSPTSLQPDQALVEDLRWILTESHRAIERRVDGLPFGRARGRGLKRNALYLIGNRRLKELRSEVSALTKDPQWAELSKWAISRMDS